jgi:pullulanase
VLWDKLAISAKDATVEERRNMQKLALSIVLTSQGISFLHAGTEFLRSKKGVENSFQSPDSINTIDWSLKTENRNVFEFVKALIKLRKEHPAFRMVNAKQIADNIRFIDSLPPGVIAYTIDGTASNDAYRKILVIFNGTSKLKTVPAPPGDWNTVLVSGYDSYGKTHISVSGQLIIGEYSCTILHQ